MKKEREVLESLAEEISAKWGLEAKVEESRYKDWAYICIYSPSGARLMMMKYQFTDYYGDRVWLLRDLLCPLKDELNEEVAIGGLE